MVAAVFIFVLLRLICCCINQVNWIKLCNTRLHFFFVWSQTKPILGTRDLQAATFARKTFPCHFLFVDFFVHCGYSS
uniref:Putative secreted protein n=1 Tax=Ixodes ricinus TaxID=34613 RepID=A0A6B0U5P6_IXORI